MTNQWLEKLVLIIIIKIKQCLHFVSRTQQSCPFTPNKFQCCCCYSRDTKATFDLMKHKELLASLQIVEFLQVFELELELKLVIVALLMICFLLLKQLLLHDGQQQTLLRKRILKPWCFLMMILRTFLLIVVEQLVLVVMVLV